MNNLIHWYYWAAFAVSLLACLAIPSKHGTADNFIGSFLVSLFGFVLWPLLAFAAWKYKKEQS